VWAVSCTSELVGIHACGSRVESSRAADGPAVTIVAIAIFGVLAPLAFQAVLIPWRLERLNGLSPQPAWLALTYADCL
jgi:uncharacterized protein (DUF983 family)